MAPIPKTSPKEEKCSRGVKMEKRGEKTETKDGQARKEREKRVAKSAPELESKKHSDGSSDERDNSEGTPKAAAAAALGRRKICSSPGCATFAAKEGLCKAHGGFLRCWVEGCTKHAVREGMCKRHHSTVERKCLRPNCQRFAKRDNLCLAHFAESNTGAVRREGGGSSASDGVFPAQEMTAQKRKKEHSSATEKLSHGQ